MKKGFLVSDALLCLVICITLSVLYYSLTNTMLNTHRVVQEVFQETNESFAHSHAGITPCQCMIEEEEDLP